MSTKTIHLAQLHAHPRNSNVMPRPLLLKLKKHIQRTGHYPPIIVRPHPNESLRSAGCFEILDGHHRSQVLRELNHETVRCDVWPVSDGDALLLLATLNRLEGKDDPGKRADLIAALLERSPRGAEDAAAFLPERAEALRELMASREPPPTMKAPRPIEAMPVAVHFFLLPLQRRQLDAALASIGANREAALMQLVDRYTGNATQH